MLASDLVDQRELKPITKNQMCIPQPLTVIQREAPPDKVCFIVSKCYFTTNSPTGHGTMCYITYNITYNRLVFLKDFWQPDVVSAQPEGLVLRELRSSGVENIPTPLAVGDMCLDSSDQQTTCTQEFLGHDEKTKHHPARLIHYHLVVQEICHPLEDHKLPRQLTKAMLDALMGTFACLLSRLHLTMPAHST